MSSIQAAGWSGTLSAGEPLSASGRGHGAASAPSEIEESAQQFEALFVTQLLASVREGGSGGWLGEEGDGASTTAIELAESQLAQAISQSGGLGLASLVARQVEPRPAPVDAPPD
jgi:Rod binding domain-containing protein